MQKTNAKKRKRCAVGVETLGSIGDKRVTRASLKASSQQKLNPENLVSETFDRVSYEDVTECKEDYESSTGSHKDFGCDILEEMPFSEENNVRNYNNFRVLKLWDIPKSLLADVPDFNPVGSMKRLQSVIEMVYMDEDEEDYELSLDELENGLWKCYSEEVKFKAKEAVTNKDPNESFKLYGPPLKTIEVGSVDLCGLNDKNTFSTRNLNENLNGDKCSIVDEKEVADTTLLVPLQEVNADVQHFNKCRISEIRPDSHEKTPIVLIPKLKLERPKLTPLRPNKWNNWTKLQPILLKSKDEFESSKISPLTEPRSRSKLAKTPNFLTYKTTKLKQNMKQNYIIDIKPVNNVVS